MGKDRYRDAAGFASKLSGEKQKHCESTEDESSVVVQNQNENQNKLESESDSDVVNISCDALAKGLSSTLTTVMRDFDSKAQATLKSQDHLSFAIDRLTKELDQLLDDAPLPFILQHAAKISGVRKRVSSLNSLLNSIQHRVDNIDRMLSVGMLHEKAALESSGQD